MPKPAKMRTNKRGEMLDSNPCVLWILTAMANQSVTIELIDDSVVYGRFGHDFQAIKKDFQTIDSFDDHLFEFEICSCFKSAILLSTNFPFNVAYSTGTLDQMDSIAYIKLKSAKYIEPHSKEPIEHNEFVILDSLLRISQKNGKKIADTL